MSKSKRVVLLAVLFSLAAVLFLALRLAVGPSEKSDSIKSTESTVGGPKAGTVNAALRTSGRNALAPQPGLAGARQMGSGSPARNAPVTATRAGDDSQISPEARRQIAALEAEKARRTATQLKIDSQLLYADKMRQGLPVAEGVPTQRVNLNQDNLGRVLVDIKAQVSAGLLQEIETLGGSVVNSFAEYNAIRASIPLAAIEELAAQSGVRFVSPAARARRQAEGPDYEGDFTHQANAARRLYGADGSGIKVGVLSDSVDYMTNVQAAGALGPVTVLAGQSDVGEGSGEGTAMLEIVHTLAPGARLFFATGDNGTASMAANIRALRSAGCDIIVDDLLYPTESPFQDDIVADAINTVTTGGGLYFSSAGNAGNVNQGTAGVWEGDFADGGPTTAVLNETGRIHSFGQINYNPIAVGGGEVDLFWSDPLGASGNDYDLFLLDPSGTTIDSSSTNPQTGTQDPYESILGGTTGERVIIVKYSGAGRFLHLDTYDGVLTFVTPGAISGHACATNAFAVAAVDVAVAGYSNAFTGGVSVHVESFSSDGPRRVFFEPKALTPGNFSSTGGLVRQKPDITAADGVATSVPGFRPFFGTSAAAPHAAAIAALLKSYDPSLAPPQIRQILTSSALDIETSGWDRDSGYGIVMAPPSLRAAPAPAAPQISAISPDFASGGQVYIYGTNLQTVTNVLLGDETASFFIASNSLIVATAPSGATTGLAGLTTPSGTVSSPFAVNPPQAPPNDEFTNAAVLNGSAAVVSVNTAGATKEPGEPDHAGNAGGKSVWYNWTAPSTATFALNTAGSAFQTLLSVYTGDSLTNLVPVAAAGGSSNGSAAFLTFPAASGTNYFFVLDGVDGAGGNAVLTLAPPGTVASNVTVYATGFETAQGYHAGALAGQNGWLGSGGTGGNAIEANRFPGQGMQAAIGGALRTGVTNLWVPLTANVRNDPVVQFSALMRITASTDGASDQFGWAVFNTAGQFLFSLDFDNLVQTISGTLDDGTPAPFFLPFDNDTIAPVVITMDFGKNLWSASWNGFPLAPASAITQTGAALTLGRIAAYRTLFDPTLAGDNLMIFDNYQVIAGPHAPPTVLAGPGNHQFAAGGDLFLGVVAQGEGPLAYQWLYDGAWIPGATNATLTIGGLAPNQGGAYAVLISNPTGSAVASGFVTVSTSPAMASFGQPGLPGANGLLLSLSLAPGQNYTLQASTDLSDWTTLSAFYAGGPAFSCFDPLATNFPQRFYRLASP